MATKDETKKRTTRKKATATQDIFAVLVVDRSGSMGHLHDAVVEGVNDYVQQLRADDEPGETFVSITTFDTVVDHLFVAMPLEGVHTVTHEQVQPRGNTALFDAIAGSITDAETKLKEMGREDMKVLHVTLTDGFENSSVEYAMRNNGQSRLAALVKSYEEKGNWTFVYLGMGFSQTESRIAGESMGYYAANTMSATPSAGGTRSAMDNLATVTSSRKASPAMASPGAFAEAGQSIADYDLEGDLADKTVEKGPQRYESSLGDALGGSES